MGLKVCIPFNKSKGTNFNFSNNILDYSTWKIGTKGSQVGFNQNGTTDENKIIIRDNPTGEQDAMWATEYNNIDSSSDGGFETITHSIDKSSAYRVSCWIRRENAVESLGSGSTYFGIRGYTDGSHSGLVTSSDAIDKNPYFIAHSIKGYNIVNDEWYLYVGYIYPNTHSYVSDSRYDGGVWDSKGNKITSTCAYFRFLNTSNKLMMRSYLYYSTKTDERMYWYRPRIDLINGNEPTIDDLLNLREANTLPIIDDETHNVIIEDKGVEFKEGGKIGRYYSSINGDKYVNIHKKNNSINFSNIFEGNFTVSAWINISNIGSVDRAILSYGTYGKDKMLHLVVRNWNPHFGFHSNDYNSSYSVIPNKWTNIIFVGDRTNMTQRIYADGVEIGSGRTVTSWLDFNNIEFTPMIGNRENLSSSIGNINDFRIYDHAFSSDEASNLSKGLQLHYSFKDMKNRKNYIGNGAFEGGDGVSFEYGSNCNKNIIKMNNPGSSDWVLKMQTHRLDGVGSGEYEIHPDIPLKPSTKYCMSCWVAQSSDYVGTDVRIFHGRWQKTDGSYSGTDGEGILLKTKIIDGITWKRRYQIFTTPSNINTSGDIFGVYGVRHCWYLGYPMKNTAGWRYFTDIQLEESSIPTDYEYGGGFDLISKDKSGYENHFIVNTSSSFNDGAMKFSGKESIRSSFPVSSETLTFNCWYKGTVDSSSTRHPIIVINQSGNYSQSTSSQVLIGVEYGKLVVHLWGGSDIVGKGKLINDDDWHMLTVSIETHPTNTSKRIIKGYVDSALVQEKNYNENYELSFHKDSFLWVGYNHNKYGPYPEFLDNSLIADVRTYSKDLTQTEINNLYTGGRQ